MMRLIGVILVMLVAGCHHLPQQPESAIDQTREVKFDKRLLADCEKVPDIKSAREEDVHAWTKTVLDLYSSCATFKAKENVEIKKALNIKD